MGRFAQLTNAGDDAVLDGLYREIVQSGFGDDRPYNWFASQSSRPDILNGTWSLTRNLMLEGELPAIVKQMIVVTVSVQNSCNYCKCVHGHVLGRLGVSEEIIESCIGDPDLKAVQQPHRAILKFARKIAASPAEVGQSDLEPLISQGVSEPEIMEIIALAAYCNFINAWADLSQISVDRIQ